MNKHLIILVIAVLLICIGLSGCNELSSPLPSEEDRFVGTWETENSVLTAPLGQTVTFFSDRTCSIFGSFGATYEIKDGKLVITAGEGALQYIFDYSFSDGDTVLTITPVATGSSPTVYTKK